MGYNNACRGLYMNDISSTPFSRMDVPCYPTLTTYRRSL
jgi:hypothetical protein